jgi:hypothetical protein
VVTRIRLPWLGRKLTASYPQAAQQLRFVRQWSVFGKTLCRALPELMGATLGLVLLGVAYAQMAILVGRCLWYPREGPPPGYAFTCISFSIAYFLWC